ncbi:hypothetical protein ACFVAV_01070 [Nocardia sp. NPDC057663]|uniref:hypothetical protein n=1 Tax=Nocardia sp. NPDC057663 TaxID=3346201 RepID=UPI00366DE919
MLITLVADMTPGASGIVRSRTGEWPATWRGITSGQQGIQCDVEVAIGDEPVDLQTFQKNVPAKGIYVQDGRLTICGTLSVLEDGMAALDLEPGSILIETTDTISPSYSGRVACIHPEQVLLFPTDI